MYGINRFNTIKTTADKAIADAEIKGLKLHHTSWIRGYVSRVGNTALTADYNGRFGKGMVVITPSFSSTSYCTIAYFVEDN